MNFNVDDYKNLVAAANVAASTASQSDTHVSAVNSLLNELNVDAVFKGPICDSIISGWQNVGANLRAEFGNLKNVASFLVEAEEEYEAADTQSGNDISGVDYSAGSSGGSSGGHSGGSSGSSGGSSEGYVIAPLDGDSSDDSSSSSGESSSESTESEKKEESTVTSANLKKYSSGYVFPIEEGTGYYISSKYGPRKSFKTKAGYTSSFHSGVDIAVKSGTAVHAPAGGEVIACGKDSAAGNYVKIKHPDGKTSIYYHLSSYSVKKGDKVSQGDTIAKVGSTGRATGPHLHFEVRDSNGNSMDPEKYIFA